MLNLDENDIGTVIVDCAVQLHRDLGPGLLESVYEATLAFRLALRGLAIQRQFPIPLVLDGHAFDECFRADLLVDGRVIVELKSVEKVTPVVTTQAGGKKGPEDNALRALFRQAGLETGGPGPALSPRNPPAWAVTEP